MSNYNSTLQSNNTDLQAILNTINELPEAGGLDPVLQDKTITPTTSKQTVTADSGYDGLDTVIVNAMPTATQATPSISVNSSGLITASATQTAGYVAAGTKSTTKQLTTQAAKTVTPSKSSQTAVSSGVYTTGAITVAAIPSQYITTTDATAAAGEIFSGETAYVNGSKVTGTFSIDTELSTQDSLISQIQAAVNNLPEAGSGSEDLDAELTTQESLITELSTILDSKTSGGSSGGVEYEIVTITESSRTIPFTLARVTNTFGLYNSTTLVGGMTQICGHIDTRRLMAMYQGNAQCCVVDGQLFLEGQALTAGVNFVAPYTAVFINDPNKEAIYG